MTDKPAFPQVVRQPAWSSRDGLASMAGLTRRELFAAMMLNGMLASESRGDGMLPGYEGPRENWLRHCGKDAVEWADALIAALDAAGKPEKREP